MTKITPYRFVNNEDIEMVEIPAFVYDALVLRMPIEPSPVTPEMARGVLELLEENIEKYSDDTSEFCSDNSDFEIIRQLLKERAGEKTND